MVECNIQNIASLLHNRLHNLAEREIGNYQAGFRTNRSTTDHTHTLSQIMEKSHEQKIELNELFTDFREAFDSLQKTFDSNSMEIPNTLIRPTNMTMQNTRAVVETENGRSEKFLVSMQN